MTEKHAEGGAIVVDRPDPAVELAKQTGGSPTAPQIVGLRHVGMVAENPTVLARFYQQTLGLRVVGGSGADGPFGASAFLSSNPAEDSHQIAIFTDPALRHIAFRVGTLADLRAAYLRILDMGLPIKMSLNHGVSLAFYFQDPEGNLVEVYWATGMSFDQPYGDPIDLTRPEQALLHEVERAARECAGSGISAIRIRGLARSGGHLHAKTMSGKHQDGGRDYPEARPGGRYAGMARIGVGWHGCDRAPASSDHRWRHWQYLARPVGRTARLDL